MGIYMELHTDRSVDEKKSTRQIGSEKEDLACWYLVEHGFLIVDRNFHGGRFDELDIVAKDPSGYLCFVEVKYRKTDAHGGIEGAVDKKKIKNICRCASQYMSNKRISMDTPVRFDVIFIVGEDIHLIKNAFDYEV